MKLEGLRTFRAQLQAEFSGESVHTLVYYFYSGNWHDLETETPCSESDALSLQKARGENIAHHATSSPVAWFYLPDGDCAIQLRFPKSPQLSTRRRVRTRLLRLQEAASNAYRVAHNPLTHLLARDAFRHRLRSAMGDINANRNSASEAQDAAAPRTLSILAMDIDHFKQINDTWGHLYGDQVLQSLATRLESCARRIRTSTAGIDIRLGHPSGEEFLVLIVANAGKDQFLEWANEFRRCIADDLLPNEAECRLLEMAEGGAAVQPPPLHERSVTVSVGMAIHNVAPTAVGALEPVSGLLDRADTALYRAKASGRNIAISYDDILLHFGRVIEHDPATGVVALDIGANVGSAVGQEFRVYTPTFSGKKKFQINDGRTTRTLGTYPKVELARIVAFDVQPELSFAYIDSPKDRTVSVEGGSHVEAIPAGSIGHLLPSSSRFLNSGPGAVERDVIGEIQSFAKISAEAGSRPYAIVARFSNEAVYLKKYGSVSFNVALAHLYREAQGNFSTAKHVDVVDRGAICIVGDQAGYLEERVTSFLDRLASELPDLAVMAGVCCEADIAATENAPALAPLNRAKVFEFARFAASDVGRGPQERIRHFSYKSASAALQALRESRSFEIAEADYQRLAELGVESAAILNLGGLIASSLNRVQVSMDRYAAAMIRDPEVLIYKSNFGTAAFRLGDVESVLKVLNAIPLESIQKLHTSHAFGYATYVRSLAAAKVAHSTSFVEERFLAIAPLALELPDYKNSPSMNVVREVLTGLNPTAAQ